MIPLSHCVYHILYKCNLSCEGCINYSNHLDAHQIPHVKDWKLELQALADRFIIDNIEILGGETLMHPDIQSIMEFALSQPNFKKVILVTNGLLLSKHCWIKQMVDTHNHLEVDISYHHDPTLNTKFNKLMSASLSEFSGHSEKKISNITTRMFYNGVRNVGIYKNCYVTMKAAGDKHTKWQYTVHDDDYLPIQFENDTQQAFDNCHCPYLHYVNGILHKCSLTGTLPQVLKIKGQLDKWPLLESYTGYSVLEKHNQESFNRLKQAEDVCAYCPVSNEQRLYNKWDRHSKLIQIKQI